MWKFFKDFCIYGLASILGKVAAIFLMPIYTNILTREEYGAMALITSVSGVIGLLSNLNIHSGIARDYYEEGVDRIKLVSTGFFSILTISVFVLTIMILGRDLFANIVLGLEDNYMLAFVMMCCSIPTSSLQSYFSVLTRFKKKPVLYAIGTIIQILIQISLSIVGVVFLRWGIPSMFGAIFISELFATLFFAYINKSYLRFTYSKYYIRRALIFAIPTLPAILAGWVDSSLGQVIIGRYISKEILGIYSIALSLASAFTLISTAFQNVWSPFLYENYQKPEFKKQVKQIFVIFVFALSLATIVLSLFSKEIILILSNPGYLDATKYITLLCLPMSIYLLFPFASSGVTISREMKYVAISYICGSIFNIVSLIMLIKPIGVIAVPISLCISRLVSYFMLVIFSEKRIHYSLPNYLILLQGGVVLLCYNVVCCDYAFWIRLCIFIVFTISFLIYFKRAGKYDRILQMIRKR